MLLSVPRDSQLFHHDSKPPNPHRNTSVTTESRFYCPLSWTHGPELNTSWALVHQPGLNTLIWTDLQQRNDLRSCYMCSAASSRIVWKDFTEEFTELLCHAGFPHKNIHLIHYLSAIRFKLHWNMFYSPLFM